MQAKDFRPWTWSQMPKRNADRRTNQQHHYTLPTSIYMYPIKIMLYKLYEVTWSLKSIRVAHGSRAWREACAGVPQPPLWHWGRHVPAHCLNKMAATEPIHSQVVPKIIFYVECGLPGHRWNNSPLKEYAEEPHDPHHQQVNVTSLFSACLVFFWFIIQQSYTKYRCIYKIVSNLFTCNPRSRIIE